MSTTTMPTSDPLAIVRYADVVVIVLAAPFVVLMGAPVLGYVVGGAAWIFTRVIGALVERHARTRDFKAQMAMNFGVLMGRVWIVGIAILVVGKTADRADGLMAALVALVAFTIYLGTSLVLRPSERSTPRS
jgi:cytochrome bd-type quinol oxidase subunit 2